MSKRAQERKTGDECVLAMTEWVETDFGQSDFGQTDFGQTDFGQR